MDSPFTRIRRLPQNPEAPTIHFIVTGKVIGKLDEDEATHGAWSRYEKLLQFKACNVTFRRIANRKKPAEPLWHAYFEIPASEERLRFAIVQGEFAFFVLGVLPTNNIPEPDAHSLEIELVPEFIGDRQRHHPTEAYWQLLYNLKTLQVAPELRNRAAKDEIANWNKYLQAIEKVTKDKTVLLPVTWKENKYMRKKGTTMHFEMDWKRWVESRIQYLDEMDDLHGLIHRDLTDDRVLLRWAEPPVWDQPLSDRIAQILTSACLQWSIPPSSPRWVLECRISPRFADTEAREKHLREFDSDLRAQGLTLKRNGGQYRWNSWTDYMQWKLATESGVSVWGAGEAAKVKLFLKHPLQQESARNTAIRELELSLRGQGAQVQKQMLDGQLSFSMPPGKLWSQLDDLTWATDLVSLEVDIPMVAPKASDVKDAPTPKWINSHGAIRNGDKVSLSAKEPQTLRKNYEALRLNNPDFQFPDWARVALEYQVGLLILTQPDRWWNPIRQGIKQIGGVQVNGTEITLAPLTEAELNKVCDRIRALRAELTLDLVEIKSELTFHQEHPKELEAALRRGEERLKMQFGQDLSLKQQKGRINIWLSRRSGQQFEQVKPLLEMLCGQELQYEVDRPQGYFETVLEPDKKARNEWAEERWSGLRGCAIKFLTVQQHQEYLKEIEGRGGKYHGGQDLGKLRGFQQGNPKVLVEDEAEPPKVDKQGWLLPTFIGDLAQIARLKEAMNLLQYPREGLPINPRLGQFIFDPRLARPIPVGIDVRSDRDWQLRHASIESQLNERQKEAVWRALHAEDMMLVQGPPGTGKTTVIAEIIWQALQENPDQRILISSQSHLAVDNALERLYKQNRIRPLRIAARTGKQVEPEGRVYFAEVIEVWSKAALGTKEHQENADNAVSRWMNRIQEAVVPQVKYAQPQQRWRDMLAKPTPDVKTFMKDIYLANVNVVAATCLECGQRDFKAQYKEEGFDYVIVDEASKATPPELMVPLILAKRVIIIGDHRQLPPMVDENELKEVLLEIGEKKLAAEIDEFKVSQFEKLFLGTDPSLHVTLNRQYRMHEDIMRVINPFYQEEGGLVCGITEDMDKPDLSCRGSRWHGLSHDQLLSPDVHLIWVEVDTPEISHKPGYSNEGEVEAVRSVLRGLLQCRGWREYDSHFKKDEDREIGLVSFYGKQVEKLRDVVEEFRQQVPIRLRTVDKFQGMERNIMIVSTVRSHLQLPENVKEDSIAARPRPNSDIGFAKDYRRVNVAFSRARRLLIIVGNEGHFAKNNEVYQEIRKVVGRYGQRLDAKSLPF